MKISRRSLLEGISAISIIVATPALAGTLHGVASSLNGTPKVQVGTSSGDFAFKNFMSNFGSFQASTAGYAYPAVLNADQYPFGTIGSTLFGSVFLPSNLTTATTLSFAWTGQAANASGALQLQHGVTVTAGSGFVVGGTTFNLNMSGTNGYIEFNFTGSVPSSIAFGFLNGSTFTNLSGIIFCVKSDYSSIVAATTPSQLLSPTYVNTFKALNVKSIRPMAWTNPNNGNNFTQHKYRNNWQTSLSYSGNAWIPNCWAGSSSGTNAYTASAATDTPGSYTMGEVLQLQFINASTTGALTINVGGRGVVPLLDMLGNALTGTAIAANSLATLIYDDLLAAYLVVFGGLTANVPIEIQVALANQVGCPLWYNFPPHITYSSVTSVTALIASTLTSGCYFEYANEVWNFSGGFPQSQWAINCGAALGFPLGNNRQVYGFYALRVAQMWPLVTAAWGSKQGLKLVLAFQAFGVLGVGGATNVYRMKGTDLNTSLGYTKYNSYVGANYDFASNPSGCPVGLSDVFSYATYYSGAQCANFDASYSNVGGTGLTTGGPSSGPGSAISGLVGAADAFASGDTTNSIAWLDWDIRQGANNGTAGGQTLLALKSGAAGTGIYPSWETVAASYDGIRPAGKSNITIECYEGAMECAPPSTGECTALGISTAYGGATGKIGNLLTAYKQSASFYATVQQQNIDLMLQPHSKAGSWFGFDGNNQWSMRQPPGDIYSPTWQSYGAVAAYNQTP